MKYLLIAIALTVLAARTSSAQCNVFAEETFDSGHAQSLALGEILRARIEISNTESMPATLKRFGVVLNCPYGYPYFGCVDPRCDLDGPILAYWGHLATNCPTTWMTGHYFGAEPNEVIFEAETPFTIPPQSWPSYCTVWFDLKRVGGDPLTTFGTVSGFRFTADDVVCANGAHAGGIDNNTIKTGNP